MESLLVFHALLHQELTFAKIIIMGIDVKPVRLNRKLIIVTISVMMQEKDGKVSSFIKSRVGWFTGFEIFSKEFLPVPFSWGLI